VSVEDKAKAQVKGDEGWRSFVYQDHLGFDSIGWGFCIDPKKTDGLPKPVAEFWITWLINDRLSGLRKWAGFDRQPEEIQLALLNMSYQLGVRGVLNFTRMIKALEVGDRATAKLEALDSKWARQTPARANRIADIIGGA
jgi:lysozyme